MKSHPILLKSRERKAARQRLARDGIVCPLRCSNAFLARLVASALGLPLPADLSEQSSMIRGYAVPRLPQGPLAGRHDFVFRPWVPDERWLEAVRKARAWERGPAR